MSQADLDTLGHVMVNAVALICVKINQVAGNNVISHINVRVQ